MTPLKLPPHVVAKRRSDGTYNVLFRVRKNRPDGWPSSKPLPIDAPRRGNLNDPSEVARIFKDADVLSRRLSGERDGSVCAHPSGSLPHTADLWEQSWEGDLRARTQEFYRKSLRPLIDWSESAGHPHLSKLELPAILKFLARYKDRPAQQAALRRTLSALLSFARTQGIITVHVLGAPVRVKKSRTQRKRAVDLWLEPIVTAYADAADSAGWHGLGNMLHLMWQTSADATDVCTWRRGQHFIDGAQPKISYVRGKTGEAATVPISKALAARLRNAGLYLVVGADGRPYEAENVQADNRRGTDFRRLRKIVTDANGPYRVLDHLRHSAVTDALTKGAKVEHMPSLTAHRGEQMVEQVYAQMTEDQATAVQRARGIVE